MPREINAVLEAIKNKEENMPIELYQVFLDTETLYLACYPKDIQFYDENGNPQVYTAAALSRAAIETNTDTKVDQCEVLIDNVNQEMSAYIANTEFVGRDLAIWKVFLDDISDPSNYIEIFKGEMDSPRINQYQMAVTVVSKLDTLNKKIPARTYQIDCPWTFGGEECGREVPEITGQILDIGTFESKEQYLIIDADWDYGQAAKFREGTIEINGQLRKVENTDSMQRVTVGYPFDNVEVGDSYILKAGCDKGYDTELGCQYWDNTQFYGGFLSIPESKIQEF